VQAQAEYQPCNQVTSTVDLKEADGTTLLILTNPCVSKEAHDPTIDCRASVGASMAWDRLPELLARS